MPAISTVHPAKRLNPQQRVQNALKAPPKNKVRFSGVENAKEKEDLLKEVVSYINEKQEHGFWKQVGQRFQRFFQDLSNMFKRLFSHHVDFALDNSLEGLKQKTIKLINTPAFETKTKELTQETKNCLKTYVETNTSHADKKERYEKAMNAIAGLEKSKKIAPLMVSSLINAMEPSVDTLISRTSVLTSPSKS